jgi:transcription antitermination factor NusG
MAAMHTLTEIAGHETQRSPAPAPVSDVQWYAAYTSANHEKKIASELQRRSVECFLPLYHSVRRWKDRRVELQLPLFPGYIFVHFSLQDRLRVLQIPGVVRFVGFSDGPTLVPEAEIMGIQNILHQRLRAEPHPYLTAGRRVRVKAGPLTGLQGILLRRKKKFRFVVSVEMIMRSVAIEMDECDLEPV